MGSEMCIRDRFGCGYPMGPLQLLDLIGLDTAYEILETMYRQGRDRLHAPAPILKQLVTAGMLGRKTGRGFYTYDGPDSPATVADDLTPSADDKPQLQHDVKQVGVVGTGTMASGIVEVFAKAGYDVLFVGRSQDKVAVSCADRAGFIVNALLFPYLNDAVKMLEAHYATADDIDTAMKQGCALPMGPFELLDVVGNDVSLAIQRELYLEFREPGFAPAPLLEHLVTAGYLGRKTKRGFRDYSAR